MPRYQEAVEIVRDRFNVPDHIFLVILVSKNVTQKRRDGELNRINLLLHRQSALRQPQPEPRIELTT